MQSASSHPCRARHVGQQQHLIVAQTRGDGQQLRAQEQKHGRAKNEQRETIMN